MYSFPNQQPDRLTLTRASSLFDCESVLKRLSIATSPILLSLPGDERRVYFKDLRVSAIVSAASRTPSVTVEWAAQVSADTYESLVGLAGTVYGAPYTPGRQFASVDEAKRVLAQRADILEDPPGSKETLTFCAIDQDTRTRPIALSGRLTKMSFMARLREYVSRYFDKGSSSGFSLGLGPNLFDQEMSVEELIYGFVYELYQNTYHHGSLNEDQRVIPGLRVIRLRKRVGNKASRDDFIRGGSDFTELETYLRQTVPEHGAFKFYEISISDNGMGILSRFRATTRPERKNASSANGDLEFLNRIIADSLSSDMRKSRIGQGGLQKALRAVDSVRGFVSLRTDQLWVYRSPMDRDPTHDGEWLRPVDGSAGLSAIPGTHFSIVLRAS